MTATQSGRAALEWRFDDPDDPREVTVFDPGAEDLTTAWLTVDAAHAVTLSHAL